MTEIVGLKSYSLGLIEVRDNCRRLLPQTESQVATDLILQTVALMDANLQVSMQQLVKAVSYSEVGTRLALAGLIKDGLIQVVHSPHDKRAKNCIPTELLLARLLECYRNLRYFTLAAP
jgi:hypothetical protein